MLDPMQNPYSLTVTSVSYKTEVALLSPDARQALISGWASECFGKDSLYHAISRACPLLEEACEAFQVLADVSLRRDPVHMMNLGLGSWDEIRSLAHKILDKVLDKPVGELHNELGGLLITIKAAAQSAGISAHECELAEISRVLDLPTDHFKVRKQIKVNEGVIV